MEGGFCDERRVCNKSQLGDVSLANSTADNSQLSCTETSASRTFYSTPVFSIRKEDLIEAARRLKPVGGKVNLRRFGRSKLKDGLKSTATIDIPVWYTPRTKYFQRDKEANEEQQRVGDLGRTRTISRQFSQSLQLRISSHDSSLNFSDCADSLDTIAELSVVPESPGPVNVHQSDQAFQVPHINVYVQSERCTHHGEELRHSLGYGLIALMDPLPTRVQNGCTLDTSVDNSAILCSRQLSRSDQSQVSNATSKPTWLAKLRYLFSVHKKNKVKNP